MNISALTQNTLHDASAGIARSIVEVREIQAEIKFREPFAASRLAKQINRLKTVLKDVEKLRLLEKERQASLCTGSISTPRDFLVKTMPITLSTTVRRIQYQAAKIEFLEMMCSVTPGVEVEAARNMIFTLRKSLYDACEVCLQPSVEVVTSVTTLKNISSSVSCFLEQMAGNCTSDEPEVLFIKNMLVEISSRLSSLNAYLSDYENQVAKL